MTKSMSSSTRPSRLGSRSAYDVTAPGCAASAAGGSTGQPRPAQTPSFHGVPRGTSGQAAMPSGGRPDRLPDVDVRVAERPARAATRPARRAGDSLLPGTRWSTSTPSRRSGPGREVAHDGRQVVDAAEVLDDDALDPQVVAPHLLDQLGVVPALDVDPAAAGDPGPRRRAPATDPEAVRRGGAAAGPPARPDQVDRCAVDQEARPEREDPVPAVPVLQRRRSSRRRSSRSRTTAPQTPVSASSTTRSGSASTRGSGPAPRRAGRQHVTPVPVHGASLLGPGRGGLVGAPGRPTYTWHSAHGSASLSRAGR